MTDAILEGYLAPIKAQMIPLELNIKNVGMSSGDFAAGEIGCALEPYLQQIANEMLTYCKDRKTAFQRYIILKGKYGNQNIPLAFPKST